MSDDDAIMAIRSQWLVHEESGHMSGVLGLCAEDVHWLIPGGEVLRGKMAVEAWLNGQPVTTIERIETSNIAIDVSGSLAGKRADFHTLLRASGAVGPAAYHGTHLWTLRKESPGGP